MSIKSTPLSFIFCLLIILTSCSNGKNKEIQKLRKQKIEIEKKISDCENKVSKSEKSIELVDQMKLYRSLIYEAKYFNGLIKNNHFEKEITKINLQQLKEKSREFHFQFEKMSEIEKQQRNFEKTKHICFEKKENIADVEGNTYRTIKIGSQHWMAENLKVKFFNNGDEIVVACSNELWNNKYHDQPKLCFSDESIYYDGNVVLDSRNVCPTGWHIPSDKEWMKLVNYLGGIELAGISMKDSDSWNRTDGYSNYKYPKGTNKSGFEALAVGYMSAGGNINEKGETAGFWSSSQTNDHFPNRGRIYYPNVWAFRLTYRWESIWRVPQNKNTGFSIRCIED